MRSFTFMEAAVYNLLRVAPLMLLAFYPFRDKRRFSGRITALLYSLIVLIWLFCSISNAYFNESTMRMAVLEVVCFFLIAVLYALSFRARPGKMLFICFMLINVGYTITMVSKYLESLFFPEMVMDGYRWSASLCLVPVSLAVLIPMYYFIRWQKENLAQDLQPSYIWQYSWLVPVTFYLIWSHEFYGEGESILWSLPLNNVIFFTVVNIAAFLIYYLILRMIKDNAEYMKLREENHLLSLELMQYDGLNQRIALARQGRHDLRHHILAMDTLLKEGEIDALRNYLTEIGEKYELEGALTFCSNRTVNGVLTYFAEIARSKEIELKVNLAIPEDVPIAKTDLSILFGNLLENAVEACQRQNSGPRTISVRGQLSQNTFTLAVDNTYEIVPETDRRGHFRSMKHSGAGIGTESVKKIVSRYKGVVQFEARGDLFCVSVMLYL